VWQMEEMQGTGEEEGGGAEEDIMSMLGGGGEGEEPGGVEQLGGEQEQPAGLPAEIGPPQQKGLVRRFRDGVHRVIEVTLGRG